MGLGFGLADTGKRGPQVHHIVQTGSVNSNELLLIGDVARHVGRQLFAGLGALARQAFDPYRPELHYMRGPGPKWREKHGPGAQQGAAGAGR
jgi:hypothetical protein